MTFDQIAIILLLVALLAVFALDRWRMEVVAVAGLAAGLALGLVDVDSAFSGFASPAVITVVEVLLIVRVLGRTRFPENLAGRLLRLKLPPAGVLASLCVLAAAVSVFMNNIGALALMIPVAVAVCRATGLPLRSTMMPLSAATLLGGLCSIIGTPANLIVSQQLHAATGRDFAFFDYAWAGLPAVAAGIAAIVLWMPRILGGVPESDEAPARAQPVIAEIDVPQGSSLVGKLPTETGLTVRSARSSANHRFADNDAPLSAGDRLLVEAPLAMLETGMEAGDLKWPSPIPSGERVQAVVMPECTLVGSPVASLRPFRARGVRVLAVGTRTPQALRSLDDLRLSIGDILFLQGDSRAIGEALEETEALPLAFPPQARSPLSSRLPLTAFGIGIVLTAAGLMPPQIALGLVVLVLAATGFLNLRTGLAELNWSILIMLAAMIPLGLAVETTGAAQFLAGALTAVLPSGTAVWPVASILLLALLVTPFVNNASTAIVLGPIALGVAQAASLPAEPFLMAVALGASIDFLTPFGHHNNTVVMSLGPYRFVDYARAGWPVTLAAALAGLFAIVVAWL